MRNKYDSFYSFADFAALSIFVELLQILRTNDAWSQSKLGPKWVGGWNRGFKGLTFIGVLYIKYFYCIIMQDKKIKRNYLAIFEVEHDIGKKKKNKKK